MLCVGLLIIFTCREPAAPQIDAARFCQLARPFRWSRHDTPESVAQAKKWNAMGVKLCGWRPPRKVKR